MANPGSVNVETGALPKGTKQRSAGKGWALGLMAVTVGLLAWGLGDLLSLRSLAVHEAELRAWQANSPWLVAWGAVIVYVAVAGLSLPGAAVLTLVCGWFFGFWQGLLVVSFGSTGGALVAFLLSRYLLRDWVQKTAGNRLEVLNRAMEREGAFYLFTLRLVPAVPFFVINTAMGLSAISAGTFWWVSQVGMLPGTAAYVYAGSTVPSFQVLAERGAGQVVSGQLLSAFVVLGFLPLVLKRCVARLRCATANCRGCGDQPSTEIDPPMPE